MFFPTIVSRTARWGLTIGLVLIMVPVVGQGQQKRPGTTAPSARTPWGDPNLQGIWTNNSATPLQRPAELQGRERLTDAEVEALKKKASELFNPDSDDAAFVDEVFLGAYRAISGLPPLPSQPHGGTGDYNHFWVVDRDFDNRTALITDPPDGRIPPLTAAAQKREAARREYNRLHEYDNPEDRPLSETCVTRGVPLTIPGYNSNYQIVQVPGYVLMHTEMYHYARIIPIDGRSHLDPSIRQWSGDPRGHWEGNTLVIESTNFNAKPDGTIHVNTATSEKYKLVERLTRVSPDTLNYEFTVDDPDTWTSPWTAMIPWKAENKRVFEYGCHEGNYAIGEILQGARAQEKAGIVGDVR